MSPGSCPPWKSVIHLDKEVGHQCGSGELKRLYRRSRNVRADRPLMASGTARRQLDDKSSSDKFSNP
jgi:hypothetical protein